MALPGELFHFIRLGRGKKTTEELSKLYALIKILVLILFNMVMPIYFVNKFVALRLCKTNRNKQKMLEIPQELSNMNFAALLSLANIQLFWDSK